MDPIKTVQPYKLYKKFAEAKKSVKIGLFSTAVFLIIMVICDPEIVIVPLILLLLVLPIVLYNPKLKPIYEPGVSYSWVKDYANGAPPQYLTKGLPVIGLVAGIGIDIFYDVFPMGTLFLGVVCIILAFLVKKFPDKMLYWKEDRLRMQNHQNIDFNVKVDLSDIYGINDKMTLSYQNFDFDQKRLEKGNFLLGVSPLGVYFAHKSDSVHKTFIKFDDIDTLGLLAAIGNKFIFNIKSKSNIEINIIIDQDDSLVVSPYKLFDTLLDTLDSFILHGGDVAAPTTRRRRITVSSTSSEPDQGSSEVLPSDIGRSIELDTATADSPEEQQASGNRVIDIAFTDTVIAELASGEMITANRQIEI